MSTLKAIGTVAIMIACFAVIYPRFMHPLVLRALGMNEPSKKVEDDTLFPPNYHNKPPETRAPVDDVRKHPGPHPGMRAAAEMQRQQAQQGSGRGMMGIVLPMYAIGIVLYLIYTLFKVFNKSKSNSWSKIGGPYDDRETSVDRMGFPTDFDGSTDIGSYLQDQQQRKELEALLSRVDDKNVSTEEMRILQRRLEETEAQMTRILQAMQSVQTNVNKITQDVPTYQETEQDGQEEDDDNEEGQEGVSNKETAESNTSQEEDTGKDFKDRDIDDVDFDDIDKDSDEEQEKEIHESEKQEAVFGRKEACDKGNDDADARVRQRRLNGKNEQ